MLPPLREEVRADIPRYTKLCWEHRSIWRCNRCFRIFYIIVRTLYMSTWFYYIPFMAITVNFTVTFLESKLGDFIEPNEAGEMSSEYADWVAS